MWRRYCTGEQVRTGPNSGRGSPDTDGRISRWLGDEALPGGTYSIIFASGRYFADRGVDTFYPHVEIVFGVSRRAGRITMSHCSSVPGATPRTAEAEMADAAGNAESGDIVHQGFGHSGDSMISQRDVQGDSRGFC